MNLNAHPIPQDMLSRFHSHLILSTTSDVLTTVSIYKSLAIYSCLTVVFNGEWFIGFSMERRHFLKSVVSITSYSLVLNY